MPIITCGDKEINIPYDRDAGSEYIKDIVKLYDNVDVTIPIPDKYCTVIDTYTNYSNDNKVPITNRTSLLLCFHLSTLLADDGYFKYCVQQTFNNWSYMCNMVYNEFNDDLQWSFFVLAPYDFIPQYLLDNDLFMVQWNKLNQNVVIKVNNDNEIYYNNFAKVNDYHDTVVSTYHIVNIPKHEMNNTEEVGYSKRTTYSAKNNIISECYRDSRKRQGVWKQWYNNSQHRLESELHYTNDKSDGLQRGWYDNENHTLSYERYYINGRRNGLWKKWHNNENHTLLYEGQYVDDKRHGLWVDWYNNDLHTVKSEMYYDNGNRSGLWKEWYDDEQHTLESEGYYVNGKRHGRWLEYDLDGNVISDDEYIHDIKQ